MHHPYRAPAQTWNDMLDDKEPPVIASSPVVLDQPIGSEITYGTSGPPVEDQVGKYETDYSPAQKLIIDAAFHRCHELFHAWFNPKGWFQPLVSAQIQNGLTAQLNRDYDILNERARYSTETLERQEKAFVQFAAVQDRAEFAQKLMLESIEKASRFSDVRDTVHKLEDLFEKVKEAMTVHSFVNYTDLDGLFDLRDMRIQREADARHRELQELLSNEIKGVKQDIVSRMDSIGARLARIESSPAVGASKGDRRIERADPGLPIFSKKDSDSDRRLKNAQSPGPSSARSPSRIKTASGVPRASAPTKLRQDASVKLVTYFQKNSIYIIPDQRMVGSGVIQAGLALNIAPSKQKLEPIFKDVLLRLNLRIKLSFAASATMDEVLTDVAAMLSKREDDDEDCPRLFDDEVVEADLAWAQATGPNKQLLLVTVSKLTDGRIPTAADLGSWYGEEKGVPYIVVKRNNPTFVDQFNKLWYKVQLTSLGTEDEELTRDDVDPLEIVPVESDGGTCLTIRKHSSQQSPQPMVPPALPVAEDALLHPSLRGTPLSASGQVQTLRAIAPAPKSVTSLLPAARPVRPEIPRARSESSPKSLETNRESRSSLQADAGRNLLYVNSQRTGMPGDLSSKEHCTTQGQPTGSFAKVLDSMEAPRPAAVQKQTMEEAIFKLSLAEAVQRARSGAKHQVPSMAWDLAESWWKEEYQRIPLNMSTTDVEDRFHSAFQRLLGEESGEDDWLAPVSRAETKSSLPYLEISDDSDIDLVALGGSGELALGVTKGRSVSNRSPSVQHHSSPAEPSGLTPRPATPSTPSKTPKVTGRGDLGKRKRRLGSTRPLLAKDHSVSANEYAKEYPAKSAGSHIGGRRKGLRSDASGSEGDVADNDVTPRPKRNVG